VQEASRMVDLGEVGQYFSKFGDHYIVAGCVIAGYTEDLLEGKSFPTAEQESY
jgi:hypothetical protein